MNNDLNNEKAREEVVASTDAPAQNINEIKDTGSDTSIEATISADEPILCAIDHGYANIKTPTMCFPANVLLCDDEPIFTRDILSFGGKQYIIGIGHKEFRADKIMDEDYYILTLATIAKELQKKSITQGKVILAVGLPLTWVDEQGEHFREYLLKNKEVDFTYQDIRYHVEFIDAYVLPQGLAAIASKLNRFTGSNMLVDIGNGTMNVMFINERVPDRKHRFTEKFGTYQCVIEARELLQRKCGSLPTDAQIETYLRTKTSDMSEKYQKVIQEAAQRYVSDLFHRLREHEYNPEHMKLYVVGGGGCLIKNFGSYDKDRVIFVDDIRATAKGYEFLTKAILQRRKKDAQGKRTEDDHPLQDG